MFTTKEIARITGGELVGGDTEVSSVSTDTRTLERGALFVAVKGERFDGNDYIRQAAEKGAAAAVSDLAAGTVKTAIPVVYVGNSRTAQLKLARAYRDRFGVKLCGVTGSVGKTSTKDMIYAVLSAGFNTLRTEGNLNNDIGLPRTLFRLREDAEAAVIEMGMSGRGEISELSAAAHPTCAVITNIGYCHIENLGTRENILAAKLEILDGMDADAPLIVCGSDEFLGRLTSADVGGRRLVRYGLTENCDVRAADITRDENGSRFTVLYGGGTYRAEVPAAGEHHVLNALAAFCVGTELGMSPEEIVPAFMSYEGSGMRQRVEQRGGVRVILDCYNASPTSMRSALSVLGEVGKSGRRIAVLGDMLELGERSKSLHAGLVEYAEGSAELFFLYGREMTALRDELQKRGIKTFHSINKEELSELLLKEIKSGDTILFKGSRGMKMEEIAEKIQ